MLVDPATITESMKVAGSTSKGRVALIVIRFQLDIAIVFETFENMLKMA